MHHGDVLSVYEQHAALVRRVVEEIWNAGDVDLADELFSSAYVNHGGLIPDLVKGPEGIKLSVALYRAAFPDLHIRVDGLSWIQGTIRLSWIAEATFVDARSGDGAAVKGRHELAGTSWSRAAGGKIVESWTEWDSTAALRVLGVLQPAHDGAS